MTDDGWRARYPLWDGYFAVVAAAVTGFVVAGGRSSAQTLGALALPSPPGTSATDGG
jgi:hypothetical protein